ncbi:MAG: hypothetical protein JNL83_35130 [Myxococcales bacterium]|nr:hypothetical protein [Myxococcales bacterium]
MRLRARLALAALASLAACRASAPDLAVLGEPPSEVHVPSFQTRVGAWHMELDPLLRTPRALWGGEPFESAEAFVARYAELFGTAELVEDGRYTDPQLTSIALVQRYHGLPVIGAHLGLSVARGRLILAQGVTYRIEDLDASPALDRMDAVLQAGAVLPAPIAGDRDAARLVVLPVRDDHRVTYHLAWEVTAWRGDSEAVLFVDAHSRAMLGGYDNTRYEYPGKATNLVDQRTVGDSIVQLPAAHLRLSSMRGSTTTDADGTFELPGESGPLMVSATLVGDYVAVHNAAGPEATFVGMMRPEKAYALEWTESRSTPAERAVFRGVNTTNRFVASVFPDLDWIHEPLRANVNLPRTCNAYWNGTSINFFQEGNGCNNTGRIFDVIAHEWGHGLDQHLPGMAIDGALGEFIGDEISFVQTNSPLLGPAFLTDGGAARDLDDPRYQCFDPKVRGVHAGGHLLGAVMFDVFTDLQSAGLHGEPLKRLMLRPIAIAQTRAEWYRAMLAVDDDDGDLSNGTPHECLIYRQFVAHSCAGVRWPGIPDKDPPGCPTAR